MQTRPSIEDAVKEFERSQSKHSRLRLVLAAVVAVALIVFILANVGLYTIQPIGVLPQGVTLLVWRDLKTPFFDSPDAACLRVQGGVSLLCRGLAISQMRPERIITRLPYQDWAYLMSTGGDRFVNPSEQ